METWRPARSQFGCHARTRTHPREISASGIHTSPAVRRIVLPDASVHSLKTDHRALDGLDPHVSPVVLATASDGERQSENGKRPERVGATPRQSHTHILPEAEPVIERPGRLRGAGTGLRHSRRG